MRLIEENCNLPRAADIRFLVCLPAEKYGAGRHAPMLISGG